MDRFFDKFNGLGYNVLHVVRQIRSPISTEVLFVAGFGIVKSATSNLFVHLRVVTISMAITTTSKMSLANNASRTTIGLEQSCDVVAGAIISVLNLCGT
jgi:hypothetical protein